MFFVYFKIINIFKTVNPHDFNKLVQKRVTPLKYYSWAYFSTNITRLLIREPGSRCWAWLMRNTHCFQGRQWTVGSDACARREPRGLWNTNCDRCRSRTCVCFFRRSNTSSHQSSVSTDLKMWAAPLQSTVKYHWPIDGTPSSQNRSVVDFR